MSNTVTTTASDYLISAARQVYNSTNFKSKIYVEGTDSNGEYFFHTFHFDASCQQLKKFFEQWGTDQCALKLQDYAKTLQDKGKVG